MERERERKKRGEPEAASPAEVMAIAEPVLDTVPSATLTRQQRSVLNMQQQAGNAAVRNHIQRDPPRTPGDPAAPAGPLSLNPRAASPGSPLSPPSILTPLTYSQMNAILNPSGGPATPTPAAGAASPATPAGSSEPAVEATITTRFNARHRVAGTGGPANGSTLSTETETTGHVGSGVEVSHTGTDEGHQFGVSIEGRIGGRAAPELSGEATIQLDPSGTTVRSIEVRGRAEWTRTYLNNMLQVRPFVQMLIQAEREGTEVAASAPASLSPSATATVGANARLRIGSTTIRGSASVAVQIPAHEVTTTFSAEVSQRIFGPLSISARGERRDTFGAGDPASRTTGTLGLTLGDPDGANLRLGGGIESSGGRTGLTGGATLTLPLPF